MRRHAKEQIIKLQAENKKGFDKKRREARRYEVGDHVAIKRTQQGPGLKLKTKFLGPYEIVKVKGNDTYDVIKIGFHEGPRKTSTCSEFLKPWVPYDNDYSNDDDYSDDEDISNDESNDRGNHDGGSSEADGVQDGRIVGITDMI